MLDGLNALIAAYGQDNGLVVPLSIAVVVLMYSHIHIWLSHRARLSDKDKHIEDLIDERNKLQQFLFEQQGRDRLTSGKERT